MSDENGTLASHSITVGVPTATYLCMQSKLLNILYQQYNNNQLRRLFKELWEGQEVTTRQYGGNIVWIKH